MCTRDWSHKIQTVSKLRTYITFKTSYNVEKYVLMNLNRRERSIFAQFRIGILPLRIETGRYIGENQEQRPCKICQGGQIEDETHFLFSCDLYNDLRRQLISVISPEHLFSTLSVIDKVTILMNNYPRQTAKYLGNVFDERKHFLYVNN